MNKTNLVLAEAYFKAVKHRDFTAVANHVHPEIHYSQPLGELNGKEAYLEGVKKFREEIDSIEVRAIFSADDQVMCLIDIKCPNPTDSFSIAGLLTFNDQRIIRIEQFFDPRAIISKKEKVFT